MRNRNGKEPLTLGNLVSYVFALAPIIAILVFGLANKLGYNISDRLAFKIIILFIVMYLGAFIFGCFYLLYRRVKPDKRVSSIYNSSKYSKNDIIIDSNILESFENVKHEAFKISVAKFLDKIFVILCGPFLLLSFLIYCITNVKVGLLIFGFIPTVILMAVLITIVRHNIIHKITKKSYSGIYMDSVIEPLVKSIYEKVNIAWRFNEVNLYRDFRRVGAINNYDKEHQSLYLDTLSFDECGFILGNLSGYYESRDIDDNNKTTTRLDFKGQLIVTKYRDSVNTPVRIYTSKKDLFGKEYINVGSSKYISKRGNKIDTENEEFNENFEVYCDDSTTAFYVLNPVVMEALLRIKSLFKKFSVEVYRDKVYIAINTGSYILSSPKSYKEFLNLDLREEYLNILSISDIVEDIRDGLNASINYNNMF